MKKRDLKDYNRLLREELKRTNKQKNKAEIELFQLKAKQILEPIIVGGEIKLLQNENTELVKDMNDLQADCAKRIETMMVDCTKELVSSRDWNNIQDELISKIADTAMDYIDDLNDQQADWAESNVVAGAAMLAMAKEISRITEERNRFRGTIKELKKEKYDLGKKLFDLEKQGVGDSESLKIFRAMEAME